METDHLAKSEGDVYQIMMRMRKMTMTMTMTMSMTMMPMNLVYIITEPFTPGLYFRVTEVGHVDANIPHSFIQAELSD